MEGGCVKSSFITKLELSSQIQANLLPHFQKEGKEL